MRVYLLDIEAMVSQVLKEKLENYASINFEVTEKNFPMPRTLEANESVIFGSYNSRNRDAIKLWMELNPTKKFLILSDYMLQSELEELRNTCPLAAHLNINGELDDSNWLGMVIVAIK